MTDWDDLRFFLAVARSGSLSAAARALGVNHATVSRRLRALEERVGSQLFERRPDGFAPSASGRELLAAALRVEDEIDAAERRVSGHDARLAGPLRVAMSDVAAYTLMPHLRAFGEAFPDVALAVAVSNRPTDLARREADVALRATEAPAAALVGRRLATIATSAYGSVERLESVGPRADLASHPWLAFEGTLAELAGARWLQENVPEARVVARFDSLLLLYAAVREGLGVAWLPCVLGDADPALRRLVPDLVLRGTTLWALTHPDLRSTARVRAFLDFMRDAIAQMRERVEGRRPQPVPVRRRLPRARGRLRAEPGAS